MTFFKSTFSHTYLRELINNPITMASYLSILNMLLNVTCKESRMKKYKETLDA